MQFLLTLAVQNPSPVIPVNYQYPLSAAIYKILNTADEKYASFLHETGYGKGFKLFTFSQINCPFEIKGDRLFLKSSKLKCTVCFHIPHGAEIFIKGLFLSQEIVIADNLSKCTFNVSTVEVQKYPLSDISPEEIVTKEFIILSPVVCGVKNQRGNYDFLSPEDPHFKEVIIYNWREKIKSCYEASVAENAGLAAEIKPLKYPPKSRLLAIKANTREQTKIRGWMNFGLEVTSERRFLDLLLNAGVGVYNSMGCGCVAIKK